MIKQYVTFKRPSIDVPWFSEVDKPDIKNIINRANDKRVPYFNSGALQILGPFDTEDNLERAYVVKFLNEASQDAVMLDRVLIAFRLARNAYCAENDITISTATPQNIPKAIAAYEQD